MYNKSRMTNKIFPIGCVTSPDFKESGFIDVSDLGNRVKTVEECIEKADNLGYLCAENNNKDSKCTHVAYRNGDIYDLLREADNEYTKSKDCQNNIDKKKYLDKSLKLFKSIWLHFSADERKKQLNNNFMYGYAPWIFKNNNYMKYFSNNVNSDRKELPMNNICWIGGKNIIGNKYNKFIDGENASSQGCKNDIYIVPGTEGDPLEQARKFFTAKVDSANSQIEELEKVALQAKTVVSTMTSPNNGDIFQAFQKNSEQQKIDTATEEINKEIQSNTDELEKQKIYIDIINDLKGTSKNAINKNIDIVKDKQHVADKMEADLQILSWSLEESKNKEILQNKITTTLGIIIMLFAGLCIGLMVYYLINSSKNLNVAKNKSDTGVLDSIFGFDKIKKKSDTGILDSIFGFDKIKK